MMDSITNNCRFDVSRRKELSVVSALYAALEGSNFSHLKAILEGTNANPNEILPRLGVSPLHLAVGNESENFAEEVIRLFLQYGGNPNVRTADGQTPVHIAAAWGRAELLKLLLINGGDPWLCDADGNNAFHLAFCQKHWKVIDMLKTFRLEDLEKDDDVNQQKYVITLDKVHLYNKKLAFEYDEASQDGPVLNYTRSVATRTCENLPESVLTVTPSPHCTNNLAIPKTCKISGHNKSSEIITEDSSSYDKTTLDSSENRCIFPDRNVKQIFPQVKFYNEKNKESLNCEKNTKTNINLNEKEVLVTEDLYRNNPKIKNIVDNNANIKVLEDGVPSEISDTNKNSEEKEEHVEGNDVSETPHCSKLLFEDMEIMDEEWTASHSCFVLLDDSDYTTCDDGLDIQTIQVPQECNINHNTSTSASSSGESYVSVTEEYKYSDVEEGVVLLEKRFLVPAVSISCLQPKQRKCSEGSSGDDGGGHSLSSDCSSIPSSLDYDTDVLRRRLNDRGFVPGPIIPTTKKLYLKKLMRLEKNPITISTESKAYSPEVQHTLVGFNWYKRLSEYLRLEKQVVEQFEQPDPARRWREGIIKSSFTYLLLDPRITENLPCRVETLNKLQVWSLFLSAIFYIGKGKRSRPYSHLYQAFSLWNRKAKDSDDKKVQHILDIWKAGMGVVCLHVYQNIIPVEAYTREAAMIEAIGLRNLKNVRCGEYYGVASTWTSHQKRMLGTFLLYRAMLIFLQEGERQLRPADIG